MRFYKTFDDWLEDYELFRKNSNDRDLLISMTTRLENTSPELKDQITDHIENDTLLINPMQVIKSLYRKSDKAIVVIKEKDDIWFAC